MELLWALAADAPAVVIEANFRPYSEREREAVRPFRAPSRGALRMPTRNRRRARVLSRPRRIARYSPHYAHGDESTVRIGYRL
jgi:hypothetical protein